ncbi:MAG: GyrI-like domain-containing protein [Armatimonadetes bacterium]|nr:GyrI-like domain-containing protein [Armatimonadota bacterium]
MTGSSMTQWLPGIGMAGSIEIVELCEARRYAFVERLGPYEEMRLSSAFSGEEGFVEPPFLTLSVWLDDPDVISVGQLRSRSGVFVRDDATLQTGIEEGVIRAGKYAKMRCVGPYQDIPEAWKFLYGVWLPHQGVKVDVSVPAFEVYASRTGEIVTDLFMALR